MLYLITLVGGKCQWRLATETGDKKLKVLVRVFAF